MRKSKYINDLFFSIDIRTGVEVRESDYGNERLFYLSAFTLEIDQRFNSFLENFRSGISNHLSYLELTDVVILLASETSVCVYRGGSCTFPLYWKTYNKSVLFYTHLPILEEVRLSRSGLLSYFASSLLQSSYEPNTILSTPLIDYKRVRRGAKSVFQNGILISEKIFIHKPETDLSRNQIATQIHEAFSQYKQSQKKTKISALELSGGFDSTLASMGIDNSSPKSIGLSVEYPYYEFRHEADIQVSVGKALGIERITIDGTTELPYTPIDIRRFDEPTVFVTGLKHAKNIAELAKTHNASYLYVGHGGDQLFCTDLLEKDPISNLKIERGFLNDKAKNSLFSTHAQIKNSAWLQRSSGCFVYDACIDMWMKEEYGLTVRTPFTDLKLFKAALNWSCWCSSIAAKPDKDILVEAVGEYIPHNVLNRKGKVAYDGVWLRGYTDNQDHICSTFEKSASILDYLGVSTQWLISRVKQIANWEDVPSHEIVAAYAISHWLVNWGINDPSDFQWDSDRI